MGSTRLPCLICSRIVPGFFSRILAGHDRGPWSSASSTPTVRFLLKIVTFPLSIPPLWHFFLVTRPDDHARFRASYAASISRILAAFSAQSSSPSGWSSVRSPPVVVFLGARLAVADLNCRSLTATVAVAWDAASCRMKLCRARGAPLRCSRFFRHRLTIGSTASGQPPSARTVCGRRIAPASLNVHWAAPAALQQSSRLRRRDRV